MVRLLMIGIYGIYNRKNSKEYVGSSSDIGARWAAHINMLRVNNHPNKHLQGAWNLYGEEVFEFYILDLCNNVDDLFSLEQLYINELMPAYNKCPVAGSRLGSKNSDESRIRMSKSRIGYITPTETRNKISKSLLGHKVNQETRDKISATLRKYHND